MMSCALLLAFELCVGSILYAMHFNVGLSLSLAILTTIICIIIVSVVFLYLKRRVSKNRNEQSNITNTYTEFLNYNKFDVNAKIKEVNDDIANNRPIARERSKYKYGMVTDFTIKNNNIVTFVHEQWTQI